MFEGTRSILADREISPKSQKRDDSNDDDDDSATKTTGGGGTRQTPISVAC